MPKPLNVDWQLCKSLYLQGFTLRDVATQTGCSYVALRSRAYREEWSALVAETMQKVQRIASATLEQRAEKWTHRLADLMESRLSYLESLDPAKLKLGELETLTRVTELTDRTARRNLGLDNLQASQSNGWGRGVAPWSVIDITPGVFGSALALKCGNAEPEPQEH